MRRGVGIAGWRRPWVIPHGQLLTAFGSLRGDLYQIDGMQPRFGEDRRGTGRFFPQGGLEWSWPFAQTWEKQSLILQPVVQMRGAPPTAIGVSAKKIPNEDSVDFLFNELNLYSTDRFPGYDVVDTGSRTVYGGEAILTGEPLGEVDLFFGQSYAFAHEDIFNKLQGIRKGASDYVGHIEVFPIDWVSVHYRFRLAQKDWSPLVSEVGGSVGPAIASLSGTYVFLARNASLVGAAPFEQLNLVFSSQFTKHWAFNANLLQNLRSTDVYGKSLLRGVGLTYRDDCFAVSAGVQRQYFVAQDLRPSTIYLLTIELKNIGEFSTRMRGRAGHDPDKGPGLFGQQNSARTPQVPF